MQVQSSTTDTTVSVTHSRATRTVATGATVYVVIDGTAETTAAALSRVNEKLKAVSDTLARFGTRVHVDAPIPYKVGINSQPGYPPASSTGYIAYTLLRVDVARISDFGTVQAAALGAGAASITGVTFGSSAADSLWRSNVGAATAAAHATAEMLAATQGKRLGELLDMSANRSANDYQGGSGISLDPRSSGYGGAPEIMVSTNVSVRYRLLPKK
jgi:uncharacterized protein YggE